MHLSDGNSPGHLAVLGIALWGHLPPPTSVAQLSAHMHVHTCMPKHMHKCRCAHAHLHGSILPPCFWHSPGSTDYAHAPVRVEPLVELRAVHVACAKYHSAAISADGQLFTWGWGRGGRLGACVRVRGGWGGGHSLVRAQEGLS